MIIFSSPKPFRSDTEPVQRSAIRSWKAAFPGAAIFLFGEVETLAGICEQEGVIAGGPLTAGPKGGEVITPMFQHMTSRFQSQPVLYLNADIFLEPKIDRFIKNLLDKDGPWIASTRRWRVSRFEGPEISEGQWPSFWKGVHARGCYGDACSMDLFIFKKFSLEKMPPFLVGHAGWDNWLIFHARARGIPVIDLSAVVRAIHCDHDYSYATKNTKPNLRDGPLEEHNLRLLGPENHRFHLGHATHEMKGNYIFRKKGLAPLQRNFEFWQIRNPEVRWLLRIIKSALRPIFRLWEGHTTLAEDWSCKKPDLTFQCNQKI